MKNLTKQVVIIAIAMSAIVGCKKQADRNFDRPAGAGGPFTGADSVISGNISVSRTLSPGKVYKLSGIVFVINGARLTIKPGTVITAGEKVNYRTTVSSPYLNAIAGVLVITRGSSIDAAGTPAQPIVFTTSKQVGTRLAGDFGGLILLGRSTINTLNNRVEGLPAYDENGASLGADIGYGGINATDNSGRLKYIRIEYAGYKLSPDNGVNGLTLAGVGSATEVNHIQVSYSAADAFAFAGGTVNASFLVAIGAEDDDFDFTYGYTGNIQYAIGLKDPSSAHSKSGGISDSNGIESDNDYQGTINNPKTKPHLSNFTLLGYSTISTELRAGTRWRKNSDLSIIKSIIAGYNTGAEFQVGTELSATEGGFTNNQVHAFTTVFSPASAVSLIGGTHTTSTQADPNAFTGLGLRGTWNLNPFYTTGASGTYNINNLRPRILTSTQGAVLNSTIDEWNSGWLQFLPQTSLD